MAAPLLALRYGDEDSAFTVFVGIDFGTTYSGFAFALGRQSDKIYIQPQPGANNHKLPTALLLDKQLRLVAFGNNAVAKYFEDDDDDSDSDDLYFFDRFKMTLHKDKNVRGSRLLTAANGKQVEARVVFARALQYFVQTARKEISRSTGVTLHEEEIKWIVTVPAIWGDRAKEFMQQAALEAGIGREDRVEIALEPEAAALSCRADLQVVWHDLGSPKVLRYVVVDCGGGTVDVTVHAVDVSDDRSKIDEVEPASGDAWGGTMVDKNIENIVEKFFGNDCMQKIDRNAWLQFSRTEIEDGKKKVGDAVGKVSLKCSHEMLSAMRESACDFGAAQRRVPGVVFRDKHSVLRFDETVLETCFAEPLECIVNHVKSVKARVGNVNVILVVGGFAESKLLIQKMEEAFKSNGCRVIHPMDASLAVVKGAVLYGQNPNLIQTRKARHSYGVEVSVPFDETVHSPTHRRVVEGKVFCEKVFSHYVRRGNTMRIDNPMTINICPRESAQKGMVLALYSSPRCDVQYTDEPECEKLLELRVSMPRVEKGQNRTVQATIDFSRTKIRFTAIDQSSMQQANKGIRYQDL